MPLAKVIRFVSSAKFVAILVTGISNERIMLLNKEVCHCLLLGHEATFFRENTLVEFGLPSP